MMRDTEFGPEKFCNQCQEWWPATDEFFFKSSKGYLRSPCKACIDDKRRKTNALKPCCVPGCNNPRYHWRFSRCKQHQQEANRVRYMRQKVGLR